MSKTTVLIVENEAVVAADLSGKLRRLGYEVCGTASKGEDAVALACSLRPQLVLMEIRLEGSMDGIAAAETIRSRIDVPVTYLTALSDAATLARAKITDPFGYILKPFAERELATQIELALYKHQADKQIREQAAWLRVTLASIGDAVIAADASGLVTFLNPIGEKLTGWNFEQALGQPIQRVFNIINEKTRVPAEDIVDRVLKEGMAVNLANNTALIAREGGEMSIEDSAAPIKDEAGNVIGVVLVFHDVTEKRQAREALRRKEEEFRALVENAPDVISLFDRNLRRIYVNSEVWENTGRDASFMVGKSLTEAGYPDSFAQPLNAALQNVFATGREETVELDWEAPKGHIWLQIRCAPLLTADGSVERVMSIGRDITERKRMEEELLKSRNELELRVQERTVELQVSNNALVEYAARLKRLNEELQDFAFVAAHDLQEPLRKIQTFCDMAVKRCTPALDSTGREYLERVVRSAGHMRQFLHDLLQFSRIAVTSFKVVDLGRITREAVDLFEEDLDESGGLIEIGNMPQIKADGDQMLRLFQNLIDNALKYRSKESPRIKIQAKLDAKGCEILVDDNGIGFDQQFAERIFKPFQRLHGREEYEGAGMGLTICRKIVDWHGGSIRAESEPGKGTSFIIRLPVKHERVGESQ